MAIMDARDNIADPHRCSRSSAREILKIDVVSEIDGTHADFKESLARCCSEGVMYSFLETSAKRLVETPRQIRRGKNDNCL